MKEEKEYEASSEYLLIKEEAIRHYLSSQMTLPERLKTIRKDYGIFFTPQYIVDLMVSLIDLERFSGKEINILEPACGLAQFLIGIKRNLPSLYEKARLFGVEINEEIADYLSALDISKEIVIINSDYLLWDTDISFDLIIGNPPYGIPSHSEHYAIKVAPEIKEKYKKLYQTWYGKYNVYGAFIEKSVKLLKDNGQLIFIVPATFMILDEFRKLREFLSQNGGTAIIYLGADVFKPEADVACVILNYIKSSNFAHRLELFEYEDGVIKQIKSRTNWQGEVITFETDYTRKMESLCKYRLGDIYDVRISPRTPEIRNNPLIVKSNSQPSPDFLPILNGRNLKRNQVIYENYTGYWIKANQMQKLRAFFGSPHIVVGLGFREGGKVAAGYDHKGYPWMGDVYHLIRRSSLFAFDMDESEVVEYLNSEYVSRYVKEVYREITYHLSITQLENIPLPTRNEWEEMRKSLR
jgi:adenine-specific DNA-methyltransferase